MLSPETKDALAKALDAVLGQLDDSPESADLRDALTQVQDALDAMGDSPDPDAADESPEEDKAEGGEDAEKADPYSFDHAEKAMTEKRSSKGEK